MSIWQASSDGQVPEKAFKAGHDETGEPIYVVKARINNAILPGKLLSSDNYAYVSMNDVEHAVREYEVLTGTSYDWVPTSGNNIPKNALPGGRDQDGEILYIGQVSYQGCQIPGKIQPSKGHCFITYNFKVVSFSNYRTLTTVPETA